MTHSHPAPGNWSGEMSPPLRTSLNLKSTSELKEKLGTAQTRNLFWKIWESQNSLKLSEESSRVDHEM